MIKLRARDPTPGPGIVRDLTPLDEGEAGFYDFYPGTLTGCQDRGALWCLPTAANALLVFYDKAAFDRAAVPYPEPGWTWDDFLAKAIALTEPEADMEHPEEGRWGLVLHAFEYQLFVEGQIGPLVDVTADPPTLRFNRPEAISAARWIADLALVHRVTPTLINLEDAMQRGTLVEGGKEAMWVQEYHDWPRLSQGWNVGIVPFPVGIAPSLAGDGKQSGASESTPFWASDKVFISAGTAHSGAAWRWLKALGEGAMETYEGRFLPARRSVAEGTGGFLDQAAPELEAALRYAVEHGYGMQGSMGGFDALASSPAGGLFYDAIGTILGGEKSVEDALAEAQVQVKAAIQAEMERQAQATPVPSIVVAPPEDAERAHPGAVTIVYSPSSGTTAYLSTSLHELVERFQDTHPHIIVEIDESGLGSGGFMSNVAAGADCFGWFPMFQEPGSRDAVLSLDPFLDADPSFSTDDFYPALLAPFIRQGQLLGLPGEARPEIFKYDKTLFDAAGVAYPAANWTTGDFLETAVALTQGKGRRKRYGFVGAVSEVRSLTLMMERYGATLVDTSVDPATATLNEPSTVEALRWYVDLSTLYGVKPAALANHRDRSKLIDSGRAAMWMTLESWELLLSQDEPNFGVASIPAGPNGTAGGTAGAYRYVDGHFISAHTEVGQACWEWITFLTAQPDAVWGVPARRSVVESDAYRQLVGDERAAVYRASVAGANRAPISQFYGDQGWLTVVMVLLDRAYDQVIEGKATVEEALDAAQHTFDEYRACVIARHVLSDHAGWRACATEADPTLADLLPGR